MNGDEDVAGCAGTFFVLLRGEAGTDCARVDMTLVSEGLYQQSMEIEIEE